MPNLEDCIDPRFNFSFSHANGSELNTAVDCSKKSHKLNSFEKSSKNGDADSRTSDNGFSKYLAGKLAEILEKNIKHVNCSENNYTKQSDNKKEGIQLFTGSEELMEDLDIEEIPRKRKKKKKVKMERDDREAQFEAAAVSADWVFKQATIYNG